MLEEQAEELKKNSTLQRFKTNFWGVFSFVTIGIISLLSLFAYQLATDASPNANGMNLSIALKPPGFSCKILTLSGQRETEGVLFFDFFNGIKQNNVQIPINSYHIKGDKLVYYPYSTQQVSLPKDISFKDLKVFSKEGIAQFEKHQIRDRYFLFGTDKFGRDLYSRMLIGARVSLAVGFVSVFISLMLGILLGVLAGFFGGWIDHLIMGMINIVWSIPTLLMVMAITLALGKGFWQVFIAIGLTMWVEVARVVRGQVLSIKEKQYVIAAKALGFSRTRILLKHILPNCLAPIIVISAANFASAILVESGLSFLGLGAQPPTPSWGGIIKEHYSFILMGKSYLTLIPGGAMMVLVLSFMLIGNALRDALEVNKI